MTVCEWCSVKEQLKSVCFKTVQADRIIDSSRVVVPGSRSLDRQCRNVGESLTSIWHEKVASRYFVSTLSVIEQSLYLSVVTMMREREKTYFFCVT